MNEPGKKGSILMAIIWMTIISLLLFWLPALGSLIAGIVGGKVAGGVGRGLLAVILPGLLIAMALLVFGTVLTGLPMFGMMAAGGTFMLVLIQVGPMLVGAIIGGLLA